MFWQFRRAIRFIAFFSLLSGGVMAARAVHHRESTKSVARSTSTRSTSSVAIPSNFAAPNIQAVTGRAGGPPSFQTVASADFNGDGIPDLAGAGLSCSSGWGNAIAVLLGKGDGTFRSPIAVPAGDCVSSVTAVRLRGANAPVDLVLADLNKIQLLRGKGDGTFEGPQVVATFENYSLTSFAVGDFNGDGKIDIAACLFGSLVPASPGLYDAFAVFLGNGDGTLQAPLFSQSPADNNYTIAVGDFNNDGKLDVLTRPGLGQHGLYLSLGNGDGTFLPAYLVWTEPISIFVSQLNGINSFAVGDFNDDGNLDVAMNIDGARVDVLLGTGTGVFASTGTIQIDQHQAGGNGLGEIVAARLSPNGHVDLVVGTGYGATLVILRGNGDGTFQSPEIYPLPQNDDEGLVVGDLNNDGSLDIAIGTDGAFTENSYLTVLLNDGNGVFGPPPPLFAVKNIPGDEPATNAVGVTLADLTNNGKLDLIVTTWNTPIEPATNGQMPPLPSLNVQGETVNTRGAVAVLAGNGDGTFQTEQQFYVDGRRPIAVEAVDLDADGKKDLITVNAVDNNMSILRGNGDRTFQTSIAIDVGTNPTSLAVADFNGDNKPDIAVTNLVDNTISVFLNQSTSGNISFAPAVTYGVGTFPDVVLARDFNHDGKIDLAVLCAGDFFASDDAGKHTQLSILLGNGDGTFAPAVTQKISDADGGEAMVAADFGRGEIDLAIAHFGDNHILIYRGDGHGHFNAGATYKVGDGPEGLVAVDFDGDGKIDIAASSLNQHNIALLHGNGDATFAPAIKPGATSALGPATWHYPAYMAAGDLNGDGKPELVTTHLFEAAAAVLRNSSPTPVQLAGVVSRKVHGSAGTYDVDLTNGGIECRGGGANGDYTLVFTFANPLTSVGGVSSSAGNASGAIGADAHKYIVQLSGLTSSGNVDVTLNNVHDTVGDISSAISATLPLLVGDTTQDRQVNSADIAQTKSQSGTSVTSANFREDLTADGVINSADIALAKSKSGTAIANP